MIEIKILIEHAYSKNGIAFSMHASILEVPNANILTVKIGIYTQIMRTAIFARALKITSIK